MPLKPLKFDASEGGFSVSCHLDLSRARSVSNLTGSAPPLAFQVGLELVVNLLAPNVPDRYFEFGGIRKPLEWSGAVEGSALSVTDEWQNVTVEVEARGARKMWVAPVETVSESEEGFERVYQGSQILGVWPVDFEFSENWSSETIIRVRPARNI